jgi:hypothetical protein
MSANQSNELLEPELEEIAGDLTIVERRELSIKLARWSRQLMLSARVMQGDATKGVNAPELYDFFAEPWPSDRMQSYDTAKMQRIAGRLRGWADQMDATRRAAESDRMAVN